jgi:transcriptional regulator with XRE-family HTH domain
MLRLIRREAGKSQEALAKALGLTFQQVQKYERGANRVSASKLFEIAAFFDVPVGAFYEGLGGSSERSDAVDDVLAFTLTSEGIEIARIFPRVPAHQRQKLIELAAALAI